MILAREVMFLKISAIFFISCLLEFPVHHISTQSIQCRSQSLPSCSLLPVLQMLFLMLHLDDVHLQPNMPNNSAHLFACWFSVLMVIDWFSLFMIFIACSCRYSVCHKCCHHPSSPGFFLYTLFEVIRHHFKNFYDYHVCDC